MAVDLVEPSWAAIVTVLIHGSDEDEEGHTLDCMIVEMVLHVFIASVAGGPFGKRACAEREIRSKSSAAIP